MKANELNSNLINIIPIVDDFYIEDIQDSWDWNIKDCLDAKSYISYRTSDKRNKMFWILYNEKIAGIFGLIVSDEYDGWETSILIIKKYRGSIINTVIKHSAAAAFQKLNIQLTASVRYDNIYSLKALRKITKQEGIEIQEIIKNRKAKMFNLSIIETPYKMTSIIDTILFYKKDLIKYANKTNL